MKLKILLLNHNNVGYGTYWRVFYLGKYLSKMGNEVTMICASGKDFDLKIRREKICENFWRITLPRIKYSKYYTGQETRMMMTILQTLVYDYDLIHCFTVAQPQIGLPAVISKVLRKKPLLVDFDDLWSGGFTEEHFFLTRSALNFSERKIPGFADKITVVSDFLRERISGFGFDEHKIIKVPNGSNSDEIRPLDKSVCRKALGLEKEDKIILSIGHTYTDSLEFLFSAFSKVTEEIPEAKLMMVGKVDTSLARNIPRNVIFAGEQPFENIPQFLSASDVLALPMENNDIEKARFPIRFGDYLASGRPIVSNAVGEVKTIIQEERCGLISEPCDETGFARNTLNLMENKKMSERFGNIARKIAEGKYSWSNVSKNVGILYEELQ